jgi:hypothetical protein
MVIIHRQLQPEAGLLPSAGGCLSDLLAFIRLQEPLQSLLLYRYCISCKHVGTYHSM